MSKLLVLSITLLISSCSTYHPPEAFEAKMNRFSARGGQKNTVPKIYTQPLLLKASRAPASISPNQKIKPLNHSNRILYFIGLYGQYKALRNYASASTPIIKSCPHFHSSFIEEKSKINSSEFITPKGAELEKISNLYVNAKSNPGLFPELHLPLKKTTVKDTVFANIKNDREIEMIPYQIQTAINIHLEKTFGEIKELCDSGTSSNYFIFENLTRYQKKNKLKKDEATLKAMLKTTLISNMAILTSLEAWSNKKYHRKLKQLNAEITTRLKGAWFTDYLHQIVTKRREITLNGNNTNAP